MPVDESPVPLRARSPSVASGAVMGDAVVAASTAGDRGRVAGVFGRGFYVETDGGLFAIVAPGVWPGPLHLTLNGPFALPEAGDGIVLGGQALVLPRLVIRLTGCRRWSPALPRSVGTAPGCWERATPAPPSDLVGVWPSVIDSVRRDDLSSARVALEGRGSGLTPAGDDVLAGLLLVRSIDRRRRPGLELLAGRARTTSLSRAFLRWAAVGQSIQPAHDVLLAAADQDGPRFDSAVDRLADVGASSGRALLAGMALAMAAGPRHHRPGRSRVSRTRRVELASESVQMCLR